MEDKAKAGSKGGMEVVTSPGHPVVAVIDVWVCIMPGPPQQLDTHDVKWDIN